MATLERASEQPYDLVLMDWRMPGMNGDEATQRINSNPNIAHRPKVVMITAYGREDVIQMAERAGVDGFLIKPVSPSTLLDSIISTLGRGRILSLDENLRRLSNAPHDFASSGQLAGAYLLLVEDNDINREFAAELLRSEGIEVDLAINGEEAIEQVRRHAYDAVLMDVQMPIMDGLEAARRIRSLAQGIDGERFASVPIIAMTALAMAHDAENSRAAGMNDHVTKPIAPNSLLGVLAKWIRIPSDRVVARSSSKAQLDLPPELLSMTSLDTREGVRRIGGNTEAYRRQLRRFRENYSDAVSQLQRRVEEPNLRHAEEYCHALKGVTGNLGAVALYRTVIEIDDQLKQGKPPEAGELEALGLRLQEVMRDVDSLAAIPEKTVVADTHPLDSDQLKERLERLGKALDYDLGSVEALLAELRAGVCGTPLEPKLAVISAKVDVFDIDAAKKLLDSLHDDPGVACITSVRGRSEP